MKGKRKITVCLLILVAMVTLFFPVTESNYQAAGTASIYTNAKEFFNSTGHTNGKHIDISEGVIYFATKGKLAHTYASDYHTYYASRGFDVTLTGGGASVTFAVKIGVSLEEVPGSADSDEYGYHYQLFRIKREKLEELAKNADPVNAEKVFGAETFKVCLDTIIVRRYAGMEGTIAEDGKGGLIINSPNNNYTWVWRLRDEKQLANARSVYGGHKFLEYIGIEDKLENYKLDVYYAVDGLPGLSANSSTHVTVADGYRTADYTLNGVKIPYILGKNNKLYKDSDRLVNTMSILDPLTSGPKITKTGYHLDGEVKGMEWITKTGATFAAGGSYSPYSLNPAVGSSSTSVCLYANWKPNTYTFEYNANGGTGTMSPSKHTYDKSGKLTENKFSREGYNFIGWSTAPNGAVEYTDGQMILNETAENGKVIKLYAVWEPTVVQIMLDPQGGSNGTREFYERYGDNFYTNELFTTVLGKITIPSRAGYAFKGYFENREGIGNPVIGAGGELGVGNTYFLYNTILYAHWVDNYMPELTLEGNDTWTNQKNIVKAVATDFGAGLKSVIIYHIADNGGLTPMAVAENLNGIQTKELLFENTMEGIVRYKAVAVDMSGNTSERYTTVYYDITKPTGSLVQFTVNGNEVSIIVDVTDANAGS